jgi:hypothetical protein
MPLVLAAIYSAVNLSAQSAKPPASPPIKVVVNQDIAFPTPNAIGFLLASGTHLTYQADVDTGGGYGIQGGSFGTSRVNSVPSFSDPCLYVSDAGSNDIASTSLPTQQVVGNLSGSQTDDSSSNGIGLAANTNYLYVRIARVPHSSTALSGDRD